MSKFTHHCTLVLNGPNLPPSGTTRRIGASRFCLDYRVGVGGKSVRHVDEVFEPELEADRGFTVPHFDDDKFYALVIDQTAKFYVAVGRYLDSVHGGVVGHFVAPATPGDMAAIGGEA